MDRGAFGLIATLLDIRLRWGLHWHIFEEALSENVVLEGVRRGEGCNGEVHVDRQEFLMLRAGHCHSGDGGLR